MFPASTYNGKTIAAFPDVCKTPSPGGPVPIPYPNQGGAPTAAPVQKTKLKTPSVASVGSKIPRSSGDEPGTLKGMVSNKAMDKMQLRTQIQALHAKILNLPGGNPNLWHQLLDEYVVTTAELYKAQAGG